MKQKRNLLSRRKLLKVAVSSLPLSIAERAISGSREAFTQSSRQEMIEIGAQALTAD